MSEPVSPAPGRRNVALLTMLGAIGVLLVAVVVLLAVLLLKPSTVAASAPSPTSSATATPTSTASSSPKSSATTSTPSTERNDSSSGTGSGSGSQSTPSASASPTAAKKPLMQVFNTHGVKVACVTGTDAVPAQLNFDLTFDYSARDATGVYIGIDTNDAVANPFEGPLPPTGSIVVPFSCYGPHKYAYAAVGADGSRDEGSVTIVNSGDPDPYAR